MEEIQAFTGSLADTSLIDVIKELGSNEVTGVLNIGPGNAIWLSAGRIYLATTASSDDVAVVLFGAGVVPEAEIAEILSRPDGDATGEIADAHPDAAATLDRLLHEHNLGALFELVVPSSNDYRFSEGERHPVGDRFAENSSDLLAQAQRRLQIWTQIAARIPSTSAVFGLSAALPDGDEERLITADEWRFLSLLDGHNTVADVINETGESAFRVCSSLYRLLLEDLITEK